MTTASLDRAAIAGMHALRRRRQLNRLGNYEWFEAAYRVYLVAFFGGGAVLWLSSAIGDQPVTDAAAGDVATHGPRILGLLVAFAVLTGLRSGAQGGPLAVEAADVVHVMLGPADRRRALIRPAWQRIRSAVAAGIATGIVAGQLAGRRLPGTTAAWALGGALFGGTVALGWVGFALAAHALRLRLWLATLLGTALLGWQAVAVSGRVPGPVTTTGDLGLWGWRQHPADLAGLGVAVAVTLVGVALLRRTSLDALARRSSLVAQLRFAVTMQDLRTVILLRRQLNQERTRSRPWFRLPRVGAHAIWRRGWHSLARMPLTRIVRMAAVAVAAGVMLGAVARGTTSAVVLAGLLLFLLGMEAMEPLSQEVDQPDRADSLPMERGDLMVRHLAAPTVALVPFAVLTAAAAVLTCGTTEAIAPAAILAVPLVAGGAGGAVVSIVRDAPDPFSAANQQAFIPPEMAGVSTVLRVLVPLVVSTLAASTVLLVRAAHRGGQSLVGASVRAAVGAALVAAAVATFVRLRDRVRAQFRSFMAEGRAQAMSGRPTQQRIG